LKILFIGDPHLKISRFDLALKFLKWINELAAELQPDLIVNLGDTFDTHAVVRSEIMKEFVDHVKSVMPHAKNGYYYVLGNHDMYKPKDNKYHALQGMEDIEGFMVIDKYKEDRGISYVPYQADMSKFPLKTESICVAHQAFVGADFNGWRPKEGVVDADSVSADIIISGHIHNKQSFGKVVYPGTPYSQSLKDLDQMKGVMLFDTDTFAQKFYESPLPVWRRLTYTISDTYTIKQLQIDLQAKLNKTDHWTLDLSGPKAEVLAFRESKEWSAIIKVCDIKMNSTFTDKDKKITTIDAMSIESVACDYFDKVYKGTIDKNLLKSKALEIIQSKLTS